jgi:hypothetical protein
MPHKQSGGLAVHSPAGVLVTFSAAFHCRDNSLIRDRIVRIQLILLDAQSSAADCTPLNFPDLYSHFIALLNVNNYMAIDQFPRQTFTRFSTETWPELH